MTAFAGDHFLKEGCNDCSCGALPVGTLKRHPLNVHDETTQTTLTMGNTCSFLTTHSNKSGKELSYSKIFWPKSSARVHSRAWTPIAWRAWQNLGLSCTYGSDIIVRRTGLNARVSKNQGPDDEGVLTLPFLGTRYSVLRSRRKLHRRHTERCWVQLPWLQSPPAARIPSSVKNNQKKLKEGCIDSCPTHHWSPSTSDNSTWNVTQPTSDAAQPVEQVFLLPTQQPIHLFNHLLRLHRLPALLYHR